MSNISLKKHYWRTAIGANYNKRSDDRKLRTCTTVLSGLYTHCKHEPVLHHALQRQLRAHSCYVMVVYGQTRKWTRELSASKPTYQPQHHIITSLIDWYILSSNYQVYWLLKEHKPFLTIGKLPQIMNLENEVELYIEKARWWYGLVTTFHQMRLARS